VHRKVSEEVFPSDKQTGGRGGLARETRIGHYCSNSARLKEAFTSRPQPCPERARAGCLVPHIGYPVRHPAQGRFDGGRHAQQHAWRGSSQTQGSEPCCEQKVPICSRHLLACGSRWVPRPQHVLVLLSWVAPTTATGLILVLRWTSNAILLPQAVHLYSRALLSIVHSSLARRRGSWPNGGPRSSPQTLLRPGRFELIQAPLFR